MSSTRIARRSLRTSVLLPMLAVGLCAALVTILLAGWLTYSNVRDNVLQRAMTIAHVVNSVVERVDEASEMRRLISTMGAEQDVTFIAVIGGVPPRIRASTRQAWVGHRIADIPDLQHRNDIALAINTGLLQSREFPESSELSVTIPLLLSDSNRSEGALRNGTVVVHADTRSTYRVAWAAVMISTIGFVLIFSLVGVLGYVLFRRQVLTPLSVIGRHLSDRQTGEMFPASILAGTDEISVVAMALDQALTSSEQGEVILSATINTALDAVVQMDAAGIVTGWNTQAEEIFGWKREETIGRMLYETIIPPQYREAHIRGIKHFLATGEGPILNKRREISALHRDGHEFPIELAVTPIKIAGQYTFSSFIRDITERKRTQGELAQTNADLETALDRARELAVVAESANQAKSDFLALMSHEIRTPLNGIIGMTDLLLEGELPLAQRSRAEIVRDSGTALVTILDDVLDFARIEAGQLPLTPGEVRVHALLDDLVALLGTTARRRGVALDVVVDDRVPEVLLGYPVRLRQVLSNLIGNAVKFTQAGRIVVEVAAVAWSLETRPSLWFEVTDTGPGIPPEMQLRLFSPFSQADATTTRELGGAGLGLAICQRLVDMMGGRIGYLPVARGGSRFWFELSFDRVEAASHTTIGNGEPQASPAPRAVPAAWERAPRVLLVDDRAVSRMVAGGILQRIGCQVEVATNGREAIDRIESEAFDLVLMDCRMPVLDGYDATREVRRLEAEAGRDRTPIIALTSSALEADRARSLAAGMDDHLAKPIRRGELEAALDRWVPAAALRGGSGGGLVRPGSDGG